MKKKRIKKIMLKLDKQFNKYMVLIFNMSLVLSAFFWVYEVVNIKAWDVFDYKKKCSWIGIKSVYLMLIIDILAIFIWLIFYSGKKGSSENDNLQIRWKDSRMGSVDKAYWKSLVIANLFTLYPRYKQTMIDQYDLQLYKKMYLRLKGEESIIFVIVMIVLFILFLLFESKRSNDKQH